jgi:hypothetical protein
VDRWRGEGWREVVVKRREGKGSGEKKRDGDRKCMVRIEGV